MSTTDYQLTFTPNGDKVLICFMVNAGKATAGAGYFDIIQDSTTRYGGTNGLQYVYSAGGIVSLPVMFLKTGLTPLTSYTWKLQFKSSDANSIVVYTNHASYLLKPQSFVMDIS